MTKRKPPEDHLPARGGPKPLLYDPIGGPRIFREIVKAARETSTWMECAVAAGVSDRALFAWRERGEQAYTACAGDLARCPESERLFAELYRQTAQARLRRRLKRRQLIEKAAERDWRAAAYLEDRDDRLDLMTGQVGLEGEVSDAEIDELVHETVEELGLEIRKTTRTTRRTRAKAGP